MVEMDAFERRLADALLAHANDVSPAVDAAAVAHRVALEHPRHRATVFPRRMTAVPRVAWMLLLLAGLLTALVGGMLVAGSQPVPALPAFAPPVAPSAGQTFACPPGSTEDQELAADIAAAWSAPYDAAKIAALYAPDATFYEKTDANVTSVGLPAIQARASDLGSSGFKVTSTSTPIRQGDLVAVFQKFGIPGEATYSGLLVVQLKDGKVLNQWVYQAP